MCLAIPGKIVELEGSNAVADFDGVRRKVVIELCTGVELGKYVIVHAGYAIEVVDEEEAKKSIKMWQDLVEDDRFDFEKEDVI